MKKFFIFGSSTGYGVGSSNGSWADYLKQNYLHDAFGPNGGSKYY